MAGLAVRSPPRLPPERRTRIHRRALGVLWTLVTEDRGPRPTAPALGSLDRVYYRSADGWEAPLWRIHPRPGGSGEPVVLAHGLAVGPQSFHLQAEGSLAAVLAREGYDVYLLEHRGDRHASPPPSGRALGFDDIAQHDVPAALEKVLEISGFQRALWIGHSLGGLLGYAHLAAGSGPEIAGLVTLSSPVRFDVPRTTLRRARLVASLLPGHWSVPLRSVERALLPFTRRDPLHGLGLVVEGGSGRALLAEGVEDVTVALCDDIARWLARGRFTNRSDTLEYVLGLPGGGVPTLVVSSEGDAVAGPRSVQPVVEAMGEDAQALVLDETWGLLDPLMSPRATALLFPTLLRWLATVRHRCW